MSNSGLDGRLRDREFAGSDVCQVARISPRQLQWWEEHSISSVHRKGARRVYAPEDAIEIMVIAEFRRKGFSLKKIRQFVRGMRREIGRRLNEVLDGGAALNVVTNGKSVAVESDPGRIIELLKKSREPMFLVSLSEQAKRLAEHRPRPRGASNQLPLF